MLAPGEDQMNAKGKEIGWETVVNSFLGRGSSQPSQPARAKKKSHADATIPLPSPAKSLSDHL